MSPAPHPSRRFGYTWLWTLLPLFFTLWLSWEYTPNFPHADHWGLESDILIADAGEGVTWDLLARQKNDSRYVLSRLCYLALGKATDWNVRVEAAFCVVMAGGIAVLAWWMARRTLVGRKADLAGAVMALLILSPHQVMNWNFGVQICYFLPVAAAVGIAAVFMTRWSLARQTAAGILLAMAGAWSFAPGWLGWGLVFWGVLGWFQRTRRGTFALALAAVAVAGSANAWFYFAGYHFQEDVPLTQKLVTKGGEVLHYFLKMMGAGFAEGWLQSNQTGRGRFLNVLGPAMGGLILLWLAGLALLHRRNLLRRGGSTPAWMWAGLAGWSLLVVAMVSVARTGITLSHAFASRYLAFSIWAWIGAMMLTWLLLPGRKRQLMLGIGLTIILWGWFTGLLTGIKQMQKDAYTLRLLQGALTLSAVAPEPEGLSTNDPTMYGWLPIVSQLDELGYLHPRLVRSPLVSDAEVRPDPAIQGELLDLQPGPPLTIAGYAIDHRRSGPADSIVLSYQPDGGEEVWWTTANSRTMEKNVKRLALAAGLTGEHSRIGWLWEGGRGATPYQVVMLPERPCTIRAYVMDGHTGLFHPLAGEKRITAEAKTAPGNP